MTLPRCLHASCFLCRSEWASGAVRDSQISVFLCCFSGIITQISAVCCGWQSLCFCSIRGDVLMHIMYNKSQLPLKCHHPHPPTASAL